MLAEHAAPCRRPWSCMVKVMPSCSTACLLCLDGLDPASEHGAATAFGRLQAPTTAQADKCRAASRSTSSERTSPLPPCLPPLCKVGCLDAASPGATLCCIARLPRKRRLCTIRGACAGLQQLGCRRAAGDARRWSAVTALAGMRERAGPGHSAAARVLRLSNMRGCRSPAVARPGQQPAQTPKPISAVPLP